MRNLKLILVGLLALLASCGNSNTSRKTVKDTEEDSTAFNLQKEAYIMYKATKYQIKEQKLDLGLKFGMSRSKVNKRLVMLPSEKDEQDIFYTYQIRDIKYSISIEPRYHNNKLYILDITFLSKAPNDVLTSNDTKKIMRYYSDIFTKRDYNIFTYDDRMGNSIYLAYKDNMIAKIRKDNIGNLVEVLFINEPIDKQAKVSNKTKTTTSLSTGKAFTGTYFCTRTHDTYHFDDDHTGYFHIQCIDPNASEFTWKRSGSKVTITYTGDAAVSGKQALEYNKEKKTIIERSLDFGKLVFVKQ